MSNESDITGISCLAANEQLDLLKSIFESSSQYSIVPIDLEGIILAWNPGAKNIYGYDASEVIGKSATIIFTPEDNLEDKLKKLLDNVLEQGFWTGQMRRVRKSGVIFNALVTVTQRNNQRNELVGFTAITRDLTELESTLDILNKLTASEAKLQIGNKELIATALQAQQATYLKNAFIANVSHELRTPLNGILGYTKILLSGRVASDSPEHQEFLGNILTSADQLLHLIDDVLDLAKIESGKMKFHFENINFTQLIPSVLRIFDTLIAKKNIKVDININSSVENILGDSDKLKQVFYNYISNAIKFSKTGGKLSISILPENDNHFRFEIEDTGIGIKKVNIPKLFTEFQQLDSGSSKRYQGTGLGLALTKRIIESQGGKVGVESTYGKGSMFYGILPRTPLQKMFNEKLNENIKPLEQQSRVLIISRQTPERQQMIEALKDAGYRVLTATEDEETVNIENPFDAIILDLFQPDINSWKYVRTIRAKQPSRDAVPIVLTVTVPKPVGIGFKINDFLVKPVEPQELLSSLEWIGLTPHNKKTVLVIDSDPEQQAIAKNLLTPLGFQVICKTQAISALLAFETEHPDAVLLDPCMPEMNGFEFLESFRKMQKSLNTPLIIWTKTELSAEDRLHFQNSLQQSLLKDEIKQSILSKLEGNLPPLK